MFKHNIYLEFNLNLWRFKIIFDDYYHWDGQRRATDDFFKKRGYNYNFVNIGNCQTSAIIKE